MQREIVALIDLHVFVRNTCVRDIYSWYGPFILSFAETVTVTLLKIVYHGPGHVGICPYSHDQNIRVHRTKDCI